MASKPKIFYYCFDHQRACGGQKTMYKHVDILNDHGYDAYAFHREKGFSLSWFPHRTRVVDGAGFQRIYDPACDILVVPEDLGHAINDMPGPKVVFNQNCYYGFSIFHFAKPHPYPYLRSDVKGVMAVSEHNRAYLAFAFPHVKIRRIYFSADPKTFTFNDIACKKRMIACVPTKDTVDLYQLYHLSLCRADQGLNRLNEFEWVYIKDKSEQQVVEILRDSLALAFLSTIEGLPRIPIEAMLCGCIVLGYRHGPLAELLRPDNSFAADRVGITGLVGDLERLASLFLDDPQSLRGLTEAACKTGREYTPEREEKSVLDFWGEVLSRG